MRLSYKLRFSIIDSPYFITLETNFHVYDIITMYVMCKKLTHVMHQLSSTVIYVLSATCTFLISIIGLCLKLCAVTSNRYVCLQNIKDLQPSKSCGFGITMYVHTYVFPLSHYNNTGIIILRNLQSNSLPWLLGAHEYCMTVFL